MSLEIDVEDKLYSSCDDFEISKLIKVEIKSYLSSLEERFKKTQGKQFLYHHTKELDKFINLIYKTSLRIFFKDYIPLTNQLPITLVALGSYGREQLAMYSDIDLMIVYKKIEGYNIEPIIKKIFYIAWDAGLKLGHRAHEVGELIDASREDITIKTAMIESRFICGSKVLYVEVESKLNRIRNENQKEYALEKIEEYQKRHTKYPYSMEPDIKEGYGGIRDANTLFWISNTIYKVKSLRDLQEILFKEDEYKEFRGYLEFLFRIRSALHLSSRKKSDKLVLEILPQVAKKLGFEENQKGVIDCAKRALEAMHRVYLFSDINLSRITRRFFYNPKNIYKLKQVRLKEGIFEFENRIYCSFNLEPINLIEILDFLLRLEDREFSFDSSAIYMLKRAKKPAISTKNINTAFKKLFFRKYTYSILKAFYDANLIEYFIPAFKKVLYLPQFDGYHSLPVDMHSIHSIYHIENIQNSFLKSLYQNLDINKRSMLKIALFFHDIGKGRKREHSIVGEEIFKKFAEKIELEHADMGSILIRYHTLMTSVVQKEDIYNENTILEFVSKIRSKELLEMLFILTYADVSGVSEGRFTKFLEKLLFELYHNALGVMNKDELLTQTQKRIRRVENLKKGSEFLSLPINLQKKIVSIKSNMFFLKLKNDDIINISKMAEEVSRYDYKIRNEHFLTIEIIRGIDLNLGYLLGRLSNFSIASMDIFKIFGGKKYFRIDFDEVIEDIDVLGIEELIDSSFDMSKKAKLIKPQISKRGIKINQNHSKELAEFILSTKNQKGLLAYIASLLDEYGIEIVAAKVHTYNDRVMDTFLIEKNRNFWNNWDRVVNRIVATK